MKKRISARFGLIVLATVFAACPFGDEFGPYVPQFCVVTSITDAQGQTQATFEYDFDLRMLTRISYTPDHCVTFTLAHDTLFRRERTGEEVQETTGILGDHYRLEKWENAAGDEWRYTYDSDGHLTKLDRSCANQADCYSQTYTWADGNLLSILRQRANGEQVSWTYSYDPAENVEGIFYFAVDGPEHIGFSVYGWNLYGRPPRNLVASEVRTDPDQSTHRWDLSYTFSAEGYVNKRTLAPSPGGQAIVQKFDYDCEYVEE